MCILLLNGANAQLILQFGGTNKHPTELKLNCKLTKNMTNSINFKRKLRLMSPKSTILLVYSRIVNSLLSCIDVIMLIKLIKLHNFNICTLCSCREVLSFDVNVSRRGSYLSKTLSNIAHCQYNYE